MVYYGEHDNYVAVQYKSNYYYFLHWKPIRIYPLRVTLDKDTRPYTPIGPTILVEWEE
jgi:hypothetical protein